MKWYATIGWYGIWSRDHVANQKYITTFTKAAITRLGWNTYEKKMVPLLYDTRFIMSFITFLCIKFDMKKKNIFVLYVQNLYDKCCILKWFKAITWLGVFCQGRQIRGRLNCFQVLYFLPLCFKIQKRWTCKTVTAFIAINFIEYLFYHSKHKFK